MSSVAFYVAAAGGVGFAGSMAVVAMRALRQSRTVHVFERPTQQYMLQVQLPSHKVQAFSLPVRRESDGDRQHEKQA